MSDDNPPTPNHHIEYGLDESNIPIYPIPERLLGKNGLPAPHIGPDFDAYKREWEKSVGEDTADDWWREKAEKELYWHRPFKTVRSGGFENGDVQWL